MRTEAGEGPEVGEVAVRHARVALERTVRGGDLRSLESELPDASPPALRDPRGVFVTLEQYPSGRLRGCIGFPLPVYPLYRAIVRAASAAATEDPRFPPVREAELDALVVEVSILSRPEPIPGPPEERAAAVVIGRDGLIVEAGDDYGLLLPQVAPEQGWNVRELLEGTCEKAGVAPDAWRRPTTRVLRFTASVYHEVRPKGPIEGRAEGA